ncbi:MAG: hypothetical protein WEA61_10175 [Anaerolineales bacterium]
MKKASIVFLIGLFLFLQACASAAPSDASGNEDAPAAGPADSGAADIGAGSLDLSNPDSFREFPDNYQIAMDFRFEATQADGTPVSSSLRLDGVGQAEPLASRFTFTGSGAANIAGSETFEVAYIGDQVYFSAASMGCVNMTVDAAQLPFDTMVDTGGMLANPAPRVLPDEIINGVPVYHYAITQDNLDLSDPTAMDVSEITNGAIYVAKDGGYVVRLLLEGRGVSSLLSGDEELEGDIFYQLDLTPIASVGEITPPEGCATPAESDFPLMPGASNQASFQGFLSYQVLATQQAVVDFYKAEMGALGWTLVEENLMASIGMLRFSMDDRTVTVVATYDEGTYMSSVVVGEE